MPNPVVHFEIMAGQDADVLRRFYADVFDWKIDANNPMNYGLVDTGGGGINGGIGHPMAGGSYVTVYVEVEDLARSLAKAEARGGTTIMPPMPVPGQGITIAMFKDPAGNPIGLIHRDAAGERAV